MNRKKTSVAAVMIAKLSHQRASCTGMESIGLGLVIEPGQWGRCHREQIEGVMKGSKMLAM